MINPNICMCRAEYASDSTGNHKPTPDKEIQLDLSKDLICTILQISKGKSKALDVKSMKVST